ncbi:hypothetical protein M3Y99_01597200 [Aphelenchoides fujianensis]|nr:hypothetical protein M3Y99_01597200 [Aphelenchoides fujianensis]
MAASNSRINEASTMPDGLLKIKIQLMGTERRYKFHNIDVEPGTSIADACILCGIKEPSNYSVLMNAGKAVFQEAKMEDLVKERVVYVVRKFAPTERMSRANAMAGWEIQAIGASLGVGRPFAYGEFLQRFHDVWAEDFERLARAEGFASGLEALRSSAAFFVNEQTIRVVDDERVGRELAFIYEQRRKNRPPPTATNSRPAADEPAELPPVSAPQNGAPRGRREIISFKQVPAFVLNEVTIFNENFDTSFIAGFKRLEHCFRVIEAFGNSNELKLTDIRSMLRKTNMSHLSFRALADLYAAFRPSWKVELASDRMIFAATGRTNPSGVSVLQELRRLPTPPLPHPVGVEALSTCGVQFRCQVAAVAADGRVEVDRIDEGGRFVVSPEALFKLPSKFQQQPPFVVALDSCNADGTPLKPHVVPKLNQVAKNAMEQREEVLVQFHAEQPRPPLQPLFRGTWRMKNGGAPSRSASSTFGGGR